MSARQWLTVKNEAQAAEILIQGVIGKDFWDDSGTSEKEFTDALKEIPEDKPITIGINSEGGSVQDGLGIYNALRRRGDRVTTRIDGYALSIASVVALAGARRVSPKASVWMIHDPWTMAAGNAEDMLKTAEMLEVHGDTIAGIYADRTGLNREEAREKMRAETWFKGEEAMAMKFATDISDESVPLNKFDPSRFKNIPQELLETLAAAGKGANHGATAAAECNPVTPAAAITLPAREVGNGKSEPINPPTIGVQNMNEAPTTPAAPTPTADLTALQESITLLTQEIRARNNPPIATPRVEITREGLNELLAQKGSTSKAKFDFLKRNWVELQKSYPMIFAANTDTAAGALTPAILAEGFLTVLTGQLAPLSAFSRNFTAAATAGKRNVIEVPIVTAGGTAGNNATNFEDTTNFVGTVDDIPITPAQQTVGAHITNAEQQNGWLMGWWAEIKAYEMASRIQALVNAVITTTNFTATPLVSSAVSFTANELRTLWAQLKKSPVKNILLDGEYYARFIPSNLESFNPLATGNYPGWQGFFLNTYWTGATANTVGFACNPSAIAVGSALPSELPNMPGASGIARSTVTLPDLGLTLASYTWFSAASRTGWWTMDVMFGAAKGDGTAGVLVMSA